MNGRPVPVPWSQELIKSGEDQGLPHWGAVSYDRRQDAIAKSLCLLCGESVEQGMVFLAREDLETGTRLLRSYDKKHLGKRPEIVDGAPLHHRCAKLSRAHCPQLRGATDIIERPFG